MHTVHKLVLMKQVEKRKHWHVSHSHASDLGSNVGLRDNWQLHLPLDMACKELTHLLLRAAPGYPVAGRNTNAHLPPKVQQHSL